MDLEAERKELEALVAEMRALDLNAYFDQDILIRISQARVVMELEDIDPLIWRDKGVGITLNDVFCDAVMEIKRLRLQLKKVKDSA